MKAKNIPIEAMRFFFICILCPFHCPAVSPFLPNGYIAVEFFFVLSGFLIYYSYLHHPNIGVLQFTLTKVKRFFWPLALAIVALMLLDRKQYIYPHELTPDGILTQYFSRIPEFLFAQGFLWIKSPHAVNVTLWFITILLIGGGLIYSMLRNYRGKATSLFLPVSIIFGITYLLSFGDTGLIWRERQAIPGLECNLIRGLTEMGIGVMLACFYEQKKESIKRHTHLCSLCGVVALTGMVLIAMAHKNYDCLSLFLIPFVILACVDGKSVFSKIFTSKVWIWLGGISMYMYFIHLSVSATYYILASRNAIVAQLPIAVSFTAYLVVCLFAGYVLKIICGYLAKATHLK